MDTNQIKLKFINEIIECGGLVFGGAVRDIISETEPSDIDVYFEAYSLNNSFVVKNKLIVDLPRKMINWKFVSDKTECLWYGEKEETNFSAIVIKYYVRLIDSNRWFKVDILVSKQKPCFGKLDCIVNGLIMSKEGISFSQNIGEYEHKHKNQVEFVKDLIRKRKAGVLPGCPKNRLEKIKSKGYSIDEI